MIIGKNEVQRARYFPERLPGTAVLTIAAQSRASPSPLDARFFEPLMLRLVDIGVSRSASVELQVNYDRQSIQQNAGAALDRDPEPWDVTAFQRLSIELMNTSTVAVSSFPIHYGLWVMRPTVADKIHWGLPLTEDEQRIDKALGLSAEVAKGLLPPPMRTRFAYMVERELQAIDEVPYTWIVNVPANGEVQRDPVRPATSAGAVILEGVGIDPGASAADNVVLHIDRDGIADYATIHAYALGTLDRTLRVWIPARSELRFRVTATNAVNGLRVRLHVLQVRLSNILRIRWGLVGRDEVPADLWDRVMGGVL